MMLRCFLPVVCVLFWVMNLVGVDSTPPTKRHTVALNGHNFTLPAGYTIEVAATAPLVERPIAAAFAEDGTLFVTESSGTNEAPTKQLISKPHKLYRLPATTDGVFRERTIHIERLSMPQGVAVVGEHVFVGAPPSIWKYDAKGARPEGTEWFKGQTLTGCTNDLHGPYPGPEGYLYWTKGAFAEQKYTLPNGKPFKSSAAHIFRAKLDGTGLEPVMTGGMDNPVDVVFTATGDRIFSTTFFQHPEAGQRDGLIHAIYGGIYGKDHAPIHSSQHPWTAPTLMPVMTHLGAAAPAGLLYQRTQKLSDKYAGELYCCAFNMAKVTRHVLVPEGSTYRTLDKDFIVSDNRDFHPTDVIADADGSLLIVDTGGWYRQCCPTSQLVKTDIHGAIYRVRQVNANMPNDPRGLQLNWATPTAEELLARLDDPRPVVQERAIRLLGELPPFNFQLNATTTQGRCNRLWVAARWGRAGLPFAARCLTDESETVRRVALHVLSLTPDKTYTMDVVKCLESDSMHEKRVAAECLGRMGDPRALPRLLAQLAKPTDRVLQHALTYALIEIGDADAVREAGVTKPYHLLALAGMSDGLNAKDLFTHLHSRDQEMQRCTWWLLGENKRFQPEFEAYLARPENAKKFTSDQLPTIAKFGSSVAVQEFLARGMGTSDRVAYFQSASQCGLKQMPDAWVKQLDPTTLAKHPEAWDAAVMLLRRSPLTESQAASRDWFTVCRDSGTDTTRKLSYWAALPSSAWKLDDANIMELIASTHRDQSGAVRTASADILSRATLNVSQQQKLADALPNAGPMELAKLVSALRNAPDDLTHATLSKLTVSMQRFSLRADDLTKTFEKRSEAIKTSVTELVKSLNVDATAQKAKLDELLPKLNGGDVRRGQLVFNSPKAACATCHASRPGHDPHRRHPLGTGFARSDHLPERQFRALLRTGQSRPC
jgi:glucose/arabinose dehydrogenase